MINVVNLLVNALLQVAVFTAIPFLVYLITRKRQDTPFWAYVGMYRPLGRSLWLALGVSLVMAALNLLALRAAGLLPMAVGPATIAGAIRAEGLSGASLASLLIYAGIQTSLAEEILFRGFVAKRLIRFLGFRIGNSVQALLFGGLHLVLFTALAGAGRLTLASRAFLLLSPSLAGWLLGYIKERAGNGSVVPGWLAHAVANLVAYAYLAFVM